MPDADAWGFSPPPLDPAAARQQLQRAARDLKLQAQGERFTLQGRAVLELGPAADPLVVRLARRPAQTPEWDTRTLKTSGDLRQCLDELRRRVARWQDED